MNVMNHMNNEKIEVNSRTLARRFIVAYRIDGDGLVTDE
jgi:hypothetical protein